MKKNGFTLIELLAVIIILGVLMIIAVPAVTKYINDSRKDSYVSVAKNITGGVRTQLHSGHYNMDDFDTTYYIEGNCIDLENGYKSPYGDIEKSYVAVTTNEDGHDYYWMGVDETGTGIKSPKKVDDLEGDDIEGDIKVGDISPTIGVDKRNKVVVIGGENCTVSEPAVATQVMNSRTGRVKDTCPSTYTETIYWALQDTDSDGVNDKLVLSDSEVSGALNGSISGNSNYTDSSLPPWIGTNNPLQPSNLSYNVSKIEIIGKVAPRTVAFYFPGVGIGTQKVDLDFNDLETCLVTNMDGTFAGLGGLSPSVRIDISDWDTSKVTSMHGTFTNLGTQATSCEIVGLEYLDTSKVIDMAGLLSGICQFVPSLNLNLTRWNTSNVTDMNGTFSGLGYSAESVSLNLSNWDTSKVTNMSMLFTSLGEYSPSFNLNISNWDTRNVTNMSNMFGYAGSESTTWNIKGLKDLNTSNVKNMSFMFQGAAYKASNANLDLSGWDTSEVTSMSFMFMNFGYEASSINLNLSTWDTSKVTSMRNMFNFLGPNAQPVIVTIPKTNGNGIENTTAKFYGKTTSASSSLPGGKLFTLAE